MHLYLYIFAFGSRIMLACIHLDFSAFYTRKVHTETLLHLFEFASFHFPVYFSLFTFHFIYFANLFSIILFAFPLFRLAFHSLYLHFSGVQTPGGTHAGETLSFPFALSFLFIYTTQKQMKYINTSSRIFNFAFISFYSFLQFCFTSFIAFCVYIHPK